jgi:DNA polymerase-4
MDLSDSVAQRVRHNNLKYRTVQIKVRFDDFTTHTRAKTLEKPESTSDALWKTGKGLFETFYQSSKRPVRLIGIGVSDFDSEETPQVDLFDETPGKNSQQIDQVTDKIRDKFGSRFIHRARINRKFREKE